MTQIPDLPGTLGRDELVATAEHLARLQTETGMIPWWPGGHCDPWNHVETAMALDVAGLHAEAERAYEWLADIQRPDGSWHNYYLPDGDRDMTVEEAKVDTNVVDLGNGNQRYEYTVNNESDFAYEVAFAEYSIALSVEMANDGHFMDPQDAIFAVREGIGRMALLAAGTLYA